MITTKDAKVKVARPDEKLAILTTGQHKPKEFIIKGKAKPRDKRMITTGNVEQFQRELPPSEEEKKFAMKAKMDKLRAAKAAKAAAKKKEK